MTDTSERIAKLEAAEAIRNLRAEYAYVCDAGFDPHRIAATFTEDGVFDAGAFGRFEGREAIAAYFAAVPEMLSWSMHVMGTSRIEVADGAREATGRWYFLEPCIMEDADTWVMGAYDDKYRLDDDGRWRFVEVRLEPRVVSSYDNGWGPGVFPPEEKET